MFEITPFNRNPVTTILNSQRNDSRRGRRWPFVAALLALLTAATLFAPQRLSAQDNVFDLRFLELNNKGDLTYQNFIYSRMLDSGKWMAQVLYLREQSSNYREYSGGVGYRFATVGGFAGYGIAGYGNGTDANYFEPAFLATGAQGKWTGSFFLQRYVAVDSKGTGQWLIDPLEAAYNVAGPLTVGASIYVYRPDLGASVNKVGIKFGLNDKLGTSEIRISNVTITGQANTAEFQFRRIFAF